MLIDVLHRWKCYFAFIPKTRKVRPRWSAWMPGISGGFLPAAHAESKTSPEALPALLPGFCFAALRQYRWQEPGVWVIGSIEGTKAMCYIELCNTSTLVWFSTWQAANYWSREKSIWNQLQLLQKHAEVLEVNGRLCARCAKLHTSH